MKGATVCRVHGGNAPQVRAKAAERVKAQEAAVAVVTFGLPVDVDPQTALMQEVQRTAGHVAWLSAKVAGFESDKELLQVDEGAGGSARVVPSVWVELHQRERAHLARVCKAAIDSGLQERQVRLQERQAELVARAMMGLAERLGVGDHPELGVAIRENLLAVAELEEADVVDVSEEGDSG